MRFPQLLKLSTRAFRTNPGRTILTILGISVGIGMILFLVSLGYGLQNLIFEQITTAEALVTLDVSASKEGMTVLDKKTLKKIAKIKNIKEVSPRIVYSGQILLEDLASDVLIYGVKPSYLRLGGFFLEGGEFFKNNNEYKIVLSSALLIGLNLKPEDVIGKEVKLILYLPEKIEEKTKKERKEIREETIRIVERGSYQIVGVVEEEITAFAFLPLGTLSDLKIEEFYDLKVKVSSPKLVEKTREELLNKGFLVSSVSELVGEVNKVFTIIRGVLGVFGLVALLVASIGLVNTMTVTLLERTNEIGIMKAIGGRDQDIKKMFLLESTIIGFLGGMGGIILAKIGAIVFNGILNLLARTLGGGMVNVFYTPAWFTIFIIVFSTFVGFISGIFPSKRAALLDPLEALRYK